MRVFVSEYISSGALAGMALPGSLLREGLAMLMAIVQDLHEAGATVVISLDNRLSDLFQNPGLRQSPPTQAALDSHLDAALVEITLIADPDAEPRCFEQLVQSTDATLVIAPETDGVLERRVQRVLDLGRRPLNCLPSAIRLCGDKQALADHLMQNGIRTIPTRQLPRNERIPWDEFPSGCVLKPQDGAGSWLTFGVASGDQAAWDRAMRQFEDCNALDRVILQPWIAGQHLSMACLCGSDGEIQLLPPAVQDISELSFQYRGGRIPAELSLPVVMAIELQVRSACQSVPGLWGYVGVDVILPDTAPHAPIIVEVNPRLTTSYVGYRRLCKDNIATWMLSSQVPERQFRWHDSSVEFNADDDTFQAIATSRRRLN